MRQGLPSMASQRNIEEIVSPLVQREGGGFSVRKVIGGAIESCDPFLMLDHIGPVVYKPGEALGAPDHPHRGFETVTYVIDGGVKHQDSAGNRGTLKSGWVQWMTAGKGVVHSEMPPDDLTNNGGKMEGFQLWVNLPAKHKMIEPKYQEMPPERMPTSDDGQVIVKVIVGNEQGSPLETFTPILMLDILVRRGASHTQTIPETHNAFVYVWRGAGLIGPEDTPMHMGQGGLLGAVGDVIIIKADQEDCHILLITGQPINEPIVKYGPFVMNTEVEIQEAILDYQADKMGKMPGKEERMQQTEAAKAVQMKNGSWDLTHRASSDLPLTQESHQNDD